MLKLTVERTFQGSLSAFPKFVFTSVYGVSNICSAFKVALVSVGISNGSAAVKVFEQLITKISRTTVNMFPQVADVHVSLRDKLKGYIVRTKRQ